MTGDDSARRMTGGQEAELRQAVPINLEAIQRQLRTVVNACEGVKFNAKDRHIIADSLDKLRALLDELQQAIR